MLSIKEQCKSGKHYYVSASNYDSVVCKKCGHTIELDEYISNLNKGSLNKTLYKWNKDTMDISDIARFSLSFGKCPVVNIRFEDNILICFNRIHSRDGWEKFPSDFFDKKVIELSPKEINKIYRYLDVIKFELWENEANVLKNHIMGSCGFSAEKTFRCEFDDNRVFLCFNPKGINYWMLVRYLKKLFK